MQTVSQRLWQTLPQTVKADAMLFHSGANCRYVSGFSSSAHTVLLTKEETYFLTDFRYGEAARKHCQDCIVMTYEKLEKSLEELLRRHACKTILMERSATTLAQMEWFDGLFQKAGAKAVWDKTLDDAIRQVRAVKTPQELENIRAAQAITDAAFTYILPRLQQGRTEREIALELEFYMRQNGADGVAFDLIVVSGENGSQCHGVPGERRLQHGDFVTMDIGAKRCGYHSDMTRTVAIGSASREQRKVYETVARAQQAALRTVRAGVHCHIVDRAARAVIDEKYPKTFGHTTGHAVGLEIHEWPYFSPSCEQLLLPGMVLTVEPGIYLEGKFGVRIEDMVVVTDDGCQNLTHSPKELIVV